jgi:Tol biopolymer transport system component
VLDFGLARKVVDTTNSAASAGLSLGTLRYMAPEQCRGESASPATDVFAAGVILYELVSGAHPFESNSWLDTVNAIVNREPQPLNGPFAALAARMLSKAPADRPTASEAAQWWEGGATQVVKQRRRWALPAIAASVAILAWFGLQRAGGTNDRNLRLTDTRLDLGANTVIDERNFALSPEGRNLLFHGGNSIFVLDLAGGPAVELKNVAGQYPFWSPDGKEFGYFANGKLWRKGFPDGPSREICDAPSLSSAHWGSSDTILFASSSDAPIARVHPDGGKPVQAIPFEPGAKRQEAPYLLPDGRHFVYWSANNRRIGNLMLADLGGTEPPRVLARTASSAIYVPRPGSSEGALVYRANGGLMSLPFDSASNQIRGDAKMFAERTSRVNHKIVPATASARGDLVYREADDRRTQVKIFDRRGQLLEKFAVAKEYTAAVPSPDFKRLALISENVVTGQRELEIYDFHTRRTTPVPGAEAPGNPTWAPDGATLLAGNGSVSGGADFHRISISATGAPMVSTIPWKNKTAAWPSDWSLDGKNVVLVVDDPHTNFDIWVLPMVGRGGPRPVIATSAREQRASLSPDGRLLLYMSDESKTSEIWVMPNPPDGRKWKVSTGGGQEPKWRGDGKEIFYQSMDYALMSVRVGGTSIQPSFAKPELLFGGRSGEPALMVWHCEPSADGQKFVILTGPIQSSAAPLRLRLNWWAAP